MSDPTADALGAKGISEADRPRTVWMWTRVHAPDSAMPYTATGSSPKIDIELGDKIHIQLYQTRMKQRSASRSFAIVGGLKKCDQLMSIPKSSRDFSQVVNTRAVSPMAMDPPALNKKQHLLNSTDAIQEFFFVLFNVLPGFSLRRNIVFYLSLSPVDSLKFQDGVSTIPKNTRR